MSADSTNACPACYHRATGTPWGEITQLEHLNEVEEGDDALREYHETYISQGAVVFEYHGAQCETCGYSIPEFTLTHQIPEPPP